jgi:hypothetical protein
MHRYDGPPMTLGNMRAHGVRSVELYCACGREERALVDGLSDDLEVPLIAATVTDVLLFKSGRQLAAWLGLVSRIIGDYQSGAANTGERIMEQVYDTRSVRFHGLV